MSAATAVSRDSNGVRSLLSRWHSIVREIAVTYTYSTDCDGAGGVDSDQFIVRYWTLYRIKNIL